MIIIMMIISINNNNIFIRITVKSGYKANKKSTKTFNFPN